MCYNGNVLKDRMKTWVENWKRAGAGLESVRAQDIRTADTISSIRMFDSLFKIIVAREPLRQSSGLVEQQAIFKRAR